MREQIHDDAIGDPAEHPIAGTGTGTTGLNRRRMFIAGAGLAGGAALARAGTTSAATRSHG